MAVHKIRKGLRLPLAGEPEQVIDTASAPARVAVIAGDYIGMRPQMRVEPGDAVRRGQVLFEDKKTPRVRFTAPGSGRVVGVHRGERRALQSVVIELDADERAGRGGGARFASFTGKHPAELSRDDVTELLLESGEWTALRTRPFSRVATPGTVPHSLFVTCTDSHPLAPDPAVVAAGREADFERGVVAVSKLTDGPVFVCVERGKAGSFPVPGLSRLRVEEWSGPHPAGTVGLHIHRLDPVDRQKLVWHLGYQDVIAIGRLFESGEVDPRRVVSLAGPAVRRPRLLRTRVGASIDELTAGELVADGELRTISGSVLSGRTAAGDVLGYLGRYHQQVSVLREDRERAFLGWMLPGIGKYSTINVFASRLLPTRKQFALTTSTHGEERAMVPIGMYERVFPFDIPATFLLRSLLTQDIERAEEMGVLELDEEDLGLCTFVCPGKQEYGPYLRSLLTTIEKEG